MDSLVGKTIAIAAHIGGGKSTFVETASRIVKAEVDGVKVLTEAEFVPKTLLSRFCNDPHENAQDFQSHMHAHAAIRDKHAYEFTRGAKEGKKRVAFVERALVENFVFLETNVQMGRLSEKYRPNYMAMGEDYRQFAADLIVYLHVSNEHAVQRMFRRTETRAERECEKQYCVDDYMRVLGEQYFNFVMRHSTNKEEPPVMVINWDSHVDMTHPTAYMDAVHTVLERVNSYFAGTYKLPNFTVLSGDYKLANSAGEEMNFSKATVEQRNNEILFKLARGEDVQCRADEIHCS